MLYIFQELHYIEMLICQDVYIIHHGTFQMIGYIFFLF